MEQNVDKGYLDAASKYFTEEEWNDFSPYEKYRFENGYAFYVELVSKGLVFEKPDFMKIGRKKPPLPKPVSKQKPAQREKPKSDAENKDQPRNNYPKRNIQKIDYNEDGRNAENRGNIEPRVKYPKRTEDAVDNKETENGSKSEENSELKVAYPKRNLKKINYKEEDLLPDDHNVYCDTCMCDNVDECKIHPLFHVVDTPVPLSPKNPNRARETVPQGLVVVSSKIRNGGEGVWAESRIPMGVRFGPYEGVTNEEGNTNIEYSWQLKQNGRVVGFVDGQDPSKSNWMRYVNCARNRNEQNLMAFQYKGQMYYRTVRDIGPGTELFVYYGRKYAERLGIDTKNFNSSSEESLEDNVFECETCKFTFSSPIYLKSHVPRCRNRVISRIPVTTNEQLQNDGSGDLQESVQKTGSDCSVSQKTSKQFNQTERHTSNNSSKKLYPCDMCNKSYSNIRSLKSHERLHSGINLHICNVCDKAFTQFTYLLRHKRIHSGERPYTCDLCKKSYTRLDILLTHKRIHSGEKLYTCDLCKKSFTQFSGLLRHKRIHSGEKPYTCDLCKKSFTQFSNLLTHKRIHSGEKPYTCDLCKKSFAISKDLKRHHRVHTKERPFVCKICKKPFSRVDNLKGHMRIHTGEKPYACGICQKAFTQISNLKRHKRIHITKNPDTYNIPAEI